MRRRATILVLALALAGRVLAAPTNDDCLSCHDEPVGKQFPVSVHAGMSCTDCHADLAAAEFPHPEELAKVDCSTCHGEPVEAYGRSVHAQAIRAGNRVAATCVDCHGMHDIRAASDPKSPTYALRLPDTCGRCHGDPKIIEAGKIQVGDVLTKYHDSIHGKALSRSGLVVSAKCTDCHGNHDIRKKSDPVSRVFRGSIPETCGTCHEGIHAEYAEGVHGTKLAAGDPRAPTCADCHTAHEIRRTDAEAWRLDVLSECGSCHEQSLKTYRDTFHGQVTSLGFARTASCADCHGAHGIFAKHDARSTVADENRLATCQKCHPSGNARFATYDPHADKHDRERSPALYWSARFMQLLLGVVFVFFGLHTALWFQRSFGKSG